LPGNHTELMRESSLQQGWQKKCISYFIP